MADLVVITPSRGRPRQLNELAHAVAATTSGRVEVVGLVDDDDPERAAYKALTLPVIWTGPRRSLSAWTNYAAGVLLDRSAPWGHRDGTPAFLASLGDDHRPRTQDWDLILTEAIRSLGGPPGFAYGNDLFQGANLCTAWVVSAEIVRALGWMMLPGCSHMFVDNAILALGQATGRILYRPDVVIEHLHPAAGKAELDETYAAASTAERYADDQASFTWWQRNGMAGDVATLRHLSIAPSRR